MAYVIKDSCINCGACADECPTDAISAGDSMYVIDADKCIDLSLIHILSATVRY